jgi:hypothetical protein
VICISVYPRTLFKYSIGTIIRLGEQLNEAICNLLVFVVAYGRNGYNFTPA